MRESSPRRILVTVTAPLLVALCMAVSFSALAGTATDPKELPTIVFLGDSLTAGPGLVEAEAFPARAGEILAAAGHPVRVVNGGVSGDTTAGGLRRTDWLLRQKPAIVVVWLGANDGLRGFPVEETERNLREILQRAKEVGARILLCGMYVPPSYGPIYQKRFSAAFPLLAREFHVAFSPFPLKDVAGKPELNLPDGIHPNPAGQRVVAAVLAKDLAPSSNSPWLPMTALSGRHQERRPGSRRPADEASRIRVPGQVRSLIHGSHATKRNPWQL